MIKISLSVIEDTVLLYRKCLAENSTLARVMHSSMATLFAQRGRITRKDEKGNHTDPKISRKSKRRSKLKYITKVEIGDSDQLSYQILKQPKPRILKFSWMGHKEIQKECLNNYAHVWKIANQVS
jgi:hypothetical protein